MKIKLISTLPTLLCIGLLFASVTLAQQVEPIVLAPHPGGELVGTIPDPDDYPVVGGQSFRMTWNLQNQVNANKYEIINMLQQVVTDPFWARLLATHPRPQLKAWGYRVRKAQSSGDHYYYVKMSIKVNNRTLWFLLRLVQSPPFDNMWVDNVQIINFKDVIYDFSPLD